MMWYYNDGMETSQKRCQVFPGSAFSLFDECDASMFLLGLDTPAIIVLMKQHSSKGRKWGVTVGAFSTVSENDLDNSCPLFNQGLAIVVVICTLLLRCKNCIHTY
mgnify:FL=1